jgi:hypothetical protein
MKRYKRALLCGQPSFQTHTSALQRHKLLCRLAHSAATLPSATRCDNRSAEPLGHACMPHAERERQSTRSCLLRPALAFMRGPLGQSSRGTWLFQCHCSFWRQGLERVLGHIVVRDWQPTRSCLLRPALVFKQGTLGQRARGGLLFQCSFRREGLGPVPGTSPVSNACCGSTPA